ERPSCRGLSSHRPQRLLAYRCRRHWTAKQERFTTKKPRRHYVLPVAVLSIGLSPSGGTACPVIRRGWRGQNRRVLGIEVPPVFSRRRPVTSSPVATPVKLSASVKRHPF